MKPLIKQISRAVIFCLLLFIGIVTAEAASSEKQKFTSNISSPDSLKNTKLLAKTTKYVLLKKLKVQKTLPKKTDSFLNANKSKKAKNNSCYSSLATEGCFTNCLIRSADPETVAHCVNSCGNADYVSCGICLGIATGVVISCAWECSSQFDLRDNPVEKTIQKIRAGKKRPLKTAQTAFR